MVLAVASTSSGFTGQAISLAFDRRYGALKRTGASGVPAWTIIAGKIAAVFSMVVLQVVVLGGVAFLLGLRVGLSGIVLALFTLVLGVASFTALGLLLGGTLSSEMVLAVANLIWFILMGVVFLGIMAFEWTELIIHGVTIQSSVFGSVFYILTGFHAARVNLDLAIRAKMIANEIRPAVTCAAWKPVRM